MIPVLLFYGLNPLNVTVDVLFYPFFGVMEEPVKQWVNELRRYGL